MSSNLWEPFLSQLSISIRGDNVNSHCIVEHNYGRLISLKKSKVRRQYRHLERYEQCTKQTFVHAITRKISPLIDHEMPLNPMQLSFMI